MTINKTSFCTANKNWTLLKNYYKSRSSLNSVSMELFSLWDNLEDLWRGRPDGKGRKQRKENSMH